MDAPVKQAIPRQTPTTNGNFPGHTASDCIIELFEDSLSTDAKNMIGRRSAGAGILKAFLKYGSGSPQALAVDQESGFAKIGQMISELGFDPQSVDFRTMSELHAYAQFGNSFGLDPRLGNRLWERRLVGERSYSVIGLTHSLISSDMSQEMNRLVTDPVQPWDALVCTTKLARSVVENTIANQIEYLSRRGIEAPAPKFRLPVIPLGVHSEQFLPGSGTEGERRNFREWLKIGDAEIVLLVFGRINALTKAHPVPLLQAAQIAQNSLGSAKQIRLVFVGQFPSPQVVADFNRAISQFSPGIKCDLVDGADLERCRQSWQAADVFISLADNCQETFGLTPVEAMTAGLPVIVSDWNGYRETVTSEEFGIRIPTVMLSEHYETGINLADRYAAGMDPFPAYCGQLGQMVSIDIGATAKAIEGLARNRERRLRMGEAARRHALENFDWGRVVPRYRELFEELTLLRSSAASVGIRRKGAEPAMVKTPDALKIFRDFATLGLDADRMIKPGPLAQAANVEALYQEPVTGFCAHLLAPPQTAREILEKVLAKRCRLSSLVADHPEFEPSRIAATCIWLAKYGMLAIVTR